MYTGQLDISEGSVPILVSTAQFLDMPLLEQLLQTHALTATSNSPTPPPKPKVNRTPARATYSSGNNKIVRTPNKQELLPAGPSRIDLEVSQMVKMCYFCYNRVILKGWGLIVRVRKFTKVI